MHEVYIWVLSGVLTFMISLLVIVGTSMAKQLGKKLDALTDSMNELIQLTSRQTEQIKTLYNNESASTHRINDHANRLREIELRCAKHNKV